MVSWVLGSCDRLNTDGDESPHRGMKFGWLLVCLVLLAILAFAIALTARVLSRPPTTYHYGGRFFLFFFPFGILLFFLMVFVIARLIFGPWGLGYRRAYWRHRSEATEIVKARYARGEITKEQFDQVMRDLEQHP
jgi:putative membrane protein